MSRRNVSIHIKRAFLVLTALSALALPCACEDLSADIEEAPVELGEFELVEAAETPEPTPEPAPDNTPLPTLEPGSLNYSPRKTDFEREVWAILTKRWGLADFQAAGLMGSMRAESSFCPYNVQGITGVDDRGKYNYHTGDSVGFGLCQWTSAGRKAALRRYAVAHGDPNLVWDFDIQMGFMQSEIDMAAIKATRTMYEATEWAVLRYERPNQLYANSWPGTRYDMALQVYRDNTGGEYREPELRFDVGLPGGDGFVSVEDEATLIIDSNYYWRVTGAPDWLEIRRRPVDAPDAWEPYPCGYAGGTVLQLRVVSAPVLRDARLTIEIYRGEHEVRRIGVRYAGPSFFEVLRARIGACADAVARAE